MRLPQVDGTRGVIVDTVTSPAENVLTVRPERLLERDNHFVQESESETLDCVLFPRWQLRIKPNRARLQNTQRQRDNRRVGIEVTALCRVDSHASARRTRLN